MTEQEKITILLMCGALQSIAENAQSSLKTDPRSLYDRLQMSFAQIKEVQGILEGIVTKHFPKEAD